MPVGRVRVCGSGVRFRRLIRAELDRPRDPATLSGPGGARPSGRQPVPRFIPHLDGLRQMGLKKFALAAAKVTPVGYAASKMADHAQASQPADPAAPKPDKIKTVAQLQYSPGGLSNAYAGTKIRLLANGTIIRKDHTRSPLSPGYKIYSVRRGAKAVLDPDLTSGLDNRKHTTGVTITLADGRVLTWQSTQDGSGVRFDRSQARDFVQAFNAMAAGAAPSVASPRPASVATAVPAAAEPSVAQKLTELAALHTSGILTDDEFAAKRAALVTQL